LDTTIGEPRRPIIAKASLSPGGRRAMTWCGSQSSPDFPGREPRNKSLFASFSSEKEESFASIVTVDV
jgi:hypothetical protein